MTLISKATQLRGHGGEIGAPPLTGLAFVDGEDVSWMAYANCLGVDPDLFFPDRGEDTAAPRAVCAGCIVREDCLEYALRHTERYGIWGGLGERERRRIRAQRAMGHGS